VHQLRWLLALLRVHGLRWAPFIKTVLYGPLSQGKALGIGGCRSSMPGLRVESSAEAVPGALRTLSAWTITQVRDDASQRSKCSRHIRKGAWRLSTRGYG